MRNAVMLAGLIALTGAAMYVTGVWRLLLPARVGGNQAAEVARTPVPAKPAEFEVHSEPELSKATRTLLYEARYEELERHLEQLRQDTLHDPANEYRLTQAYEVFSDPETRTREEIDAWIQKRPDSAEALTARAWQRIGAAWKRRGQSYSKDVKDEAMSDFERLMELAGKDAEQVLAKVPGHAAAWLSLVRAQCGPVGASCVGPLVERINQDVPTSYAVHRAVLNFLQPRWGGSYQLMEKYAEIPQRHVARNPRLAVLRAFPSWGAGEDAYSAENYQEALEFYDRALAFGEESWFLGDRAATLIKLNRYEEAIVDLRRNHERWPSTESAEELNNAQKHMRDAAYALHHDKKYKEALAAYESYLNVWPDDEDVHFYRAGAARMLDNYGEALRSYRRVLELNPTRFEAVKGADYTLARESRWEQILPLWEAYIALKPEHGEAYLERGGTYFQMGDLKNAYANASKACDFGSQAGCAWRNRLKGHPDLN